VHEGITIATVLTLAAGIGGSYVLANQNSESHDKDLRADIGKMLEKIENGQNASRTAPAIQVDNSRSHSGARPYSDSSRAGNRTENNSIPILIDNNEYSQKDIPHLVRTSLYQGQAYLNIRSTGNSKINNIVGRVLRGVQVQVIGSTVSDERNSIWFEVACGDAVQCIQSGGHHYIPSFQTDSRMEYP
jgi:hypothetical protein